MTSKTLRHVLCVYPFHTETGIRDHCFPPLGLEIVAARIEPYAREIEVIDRRRESLTTGTFVRPDTDLVCFSVNWNIEREAVRKEILSVPPNVRTVLGGQYPSRDPEWWLSNCPNLDCVVRGDGQDAIREIAELRPLEEVAGLTYRENGGLAHTPARTCNGLPDDFAPNRGLRRYSYELLSPVIQTGIRFDTMSTSLGCPYSCTFCSFNRDPWGRKRPFVMRSAESVVSELSEIEADIVAIVDLDFTHDADRVARICDLIVRRGIKLRIAANARLEIARRPDVLAKMQRAGFSVLLLGVESAKDSSLRDMKKGFTTRQVRRYFSVLRRTSMILHSTFILGYFGESERDMWRMVPYAKELGIDTVNFCRFRNQRGSALAEIVAKHPGYHIDGQGNIYSDRYSAAYLRQLARRMFKRFYTAGHIVRLVKKGFRNGILRPSLLPRVLSYMVRASIGRFDPGRLTEFRAPPRADFVPNEKEAAD